ncbi:PilZ domain-containing protein [uncultured Oscillibacter sp.]|uniref:flagellar brake protein n=1 Tax=uncultured Oscillibacter sp. TaxID=876091 RepID=UPI0025DC2B5E|nr:PilZ domain-containing protein [uncultured Oscillibacter sp.]
MALFDIFKKQPAGNKPPAPAVPEDDVSIYSHMRVEVTTIDGQILFVAKLMYPRRTMAELHQCSEIDNPILKDQSEIQPLYVHIRGYHDRQRKAVYMEGVITPQPKHIWLVSQLSVVRVGNDRAFFRLDTNLEANVTKFSGRNAGEHPCRLLNISVGGARIASTQQYWEGDKLLLTVKLLEDRGPSVMYCQVLRVIEKEDGPTEYGCQFLELNEADQDKITENIFTAQRKRRSTSK